MASAAALAKEEEEEVYNLVKINLGVMGPLTNDVTLKRGLLIMCYKYIGNRTVTQRVGKIKRAYICVLSFITIPISTLPLLLKLYSLAF